MSDKEQSSKAKRISILDSLLRVSGGRIYYRGVPDSVLQGLTPKNTTHGFLPGQGYKTKDIILFVSKRINSDPAIAIGVITKVDNILEDGFARDKTTGVTLMILSKRGAKDTIDCSDKSSPPKAPDDKYRSGI